jgi:transposase-like protein
MEVAMADGTTNEPGLGRGGRISRPGRCEAVLRLLRGGGLELVSRSLGVTATTLSGWRDDFLAGGEAALATKLTDGKDLKNQRLQARLGGLMLKRELLAEKIAALESKGPLARGRPSHEPEGLALDRSLV